jgi:hypothetical protein
MRAAGKFQPSRGAPHPTPLRGATFSREREKGAPSFVISTVSDNAIESVAMDYVPFSDIVCELRKMDGGVNNITYYPRLKSLAITITKILLKSDLCVFQFEKDSQGKFVVAPWSSQEPGSVEPRILAEWGLLAQDPDPGDICWFKK